MGGCSWSSIGFAFIVGLAIHAFSLLLFGVLRCDLCCLGMGLCILFHLSRILLAPVIRSVTISFFSSVAWVILRLRPPNVVLLKNSEKQ